MESKTLPEFQSFLISRKLVPERKVHFYAYGVSRFLSFSNNNKDLSLDLRVRRFLTGRLIRQMRQCNCISVIFLMEYLHLAGGGNTYRSPLDKI